MFTRLRFRCKCWGPSLPAPSDINYINLTAVVHSSTPNEFRYIWSPEIPSKAIKSRRKHSVSIQERFQRFLERKQIVCSDTTFSDSECAKKNWRATNNCISCCEIIILHAFALFKGFSNSDDAKEFQLDSVFVGIFFLHFFALMKLKRVVIYDQW